MSVLSWTKCSLLSRAADSTPRYRCSMYVLRYSSEQHDGLFRDVFRKTAYFECSRVYAVTLSLVTHLCIPAANDLPPFSSCRAFWFNAADPLGIPAAFCYFLARQRSSINPPVDKTRKHLGRELYMVRSPPMARHLVLMCIFTPSIFCARYH